MRVPEVTFQEALLISSIAIHLENRLAGDPGGGCSCLQMSPGTEQ